MTNGRLLKPLLGIFAFYADFKKKGSEILGDGVRQDSFEFISGSDRGLVGLNRLAI
jgi:hypothetical protein